MVIMFIIMDVSIFASCIHGKKEMEAHRNGVQQMFAIGANTKNYNQ